MVRKTVQFPDCYKAYQIIYQQAEPKGQLQDGRQGIVDQLNDFGADADIRCPMFCQVPIIMGIALIVKEISVSYPCKQ